MKKVTLLLALIVFCSWQIALAQRTITGTVTDAKDGSTIPGVNIMVKGTTTGTITDLNGAFSLKVTGNDQTLVFSFIGYDGKEVAVGSQNVVNVSITQTAAVIEGVVVTALGISREKKTLGYAIQEVKGTSMTDRHETNVVNSLSGQVAGLQVIRSSNGPGGSSKILLRGNTSLTGDNQPLIVVDGIPLNNFTGASNTDFWNPSVDMGNGMSDINPDDIASISILKGASAAALYGNRAGNGVILVTTKSGRHSQGLGVSVSSSTSVESIFIRPELQGVFGEGSYGAFDNKSNASWGPKAIGQPVEGWDTKTAPLNIHNNVDKFFKTGINTTENIAIQQQYGGTSFYTSLTRTDDKSMIPGAKLNRTNLTTRATTKFGKGDKITLDTKVQYINASAENRPLNGQNSSNAFYTLFNLPRSIDISQFETSVDQFGKMIWYDQNSVNPYWMSSYNLNKDIRDRFIMFASAKYAFTNWLNLEVKAGTDMYTARNESRTYAGSPLSSAGNYSLGKNQFQETNLSTLLTARKDNVISKLGGMFTLGGNLMHQVGSGISGSAGALVVPNLFTLGNADGKPNVGESYNERKTNSVYGSLQLNWDSYLYVDGTFRNDWSSTLSKANRSFFYPSVNVAWVISDMLDKMGTKMPSWFDFAKVRFSVAQVGNDLGPYQLYNTYSIGKDPTGSTTAGTGGTLFDPNVVNENISSTEIGTELHFLNNRVSLDIAWYKSNATNQLLNLPMDPMSGYSQKKINAGNIQNKGVEIQANLGILRMANTFTWDVSANFSTNKNEVIDLAEGVTKYGIGGYDNLQIIAETGQKFGIIYGTRFTRVEDKTSPHFGELVLKDGLPTSDGVKYNLGTQQADALLGLSSNFGYKGIKLAFMFDMRFGGKMFSATNFGLQMSGAAAATVIDGERNKMLVKGVKLVGADFVANTDSVSVQDYFTKGIKSSGNLGITEANLYDATNIRLRNISLSYDFNKNLLLKTPFQALHVGVSCNNVFMLKSHLHGVDPESVFSTSTNATGFENASAPTTRVVTFNIVVGF